MTAVVIDASAIIEVFVGKAPDPSLRGLFLTGDLAAPELMDVEVASVLRRLAATGQLGAGDAEEILEDVLDAPVARVTHRALMGRVWELRHAISAYDAAYVALAEQLGAVLATCDAKLARAGGHRAQILLYARS